MYPYEIVKMLTPLPEETRAEFPPGDFVEHDLDARATWLQLIGRMVKIKPTSSWESFAISPANIPKA